MKRARKISSKTVFWKYLKVFSLTIWFSLSGEIRFSPKFRELKNIVSHINPSISIFFFISVPSQRTSMKDFT